MFDISPPARKPMLTAPVQEAPAIDVLEQLVCPAPREVNPNEQVPVTVVANLRDLVSSLGKPLLACTDLKALAAIVSLQPLLGVKVVVLASYPHSDYTPEFNLAVSQCDEVQYDSLVSEIVVSERMNKLTADQAGARQKPKPREQRLERDRTKHFDAFDRYDVKEGPSDEIDGE